MEKRFAAEWMVDAATKTESAVTLPATANSMDQVCHSLPPSSFCTSVSLLGGNAVQ